MNRGTVLAAISTFTTVALLVANYVRSWTVQDELKYFGCMQPTTKLLYADFCIEILVTELWYGRIAGLLLGFSAVGVMYLCEAYERWRQPAAVGVEPAKSRYAVVRGVRPPPRTAAV